MISTTIIIVIGYKISNTGNETLITVFNPKLEIPNPINEKTVAYTL